MNNAMVVSVLESAADLNGEGQNIGPGKGATAVEQPLQTGSEDQFHGKEVAAILDAGTIIADDAGMAQAARELRPRVENARGIPGRRRVPD